MALIEVKGVDFSYDRVNDLALKNVNLEIGSGEFISIIGGNGSGKSTLAKLLNVLLLPSSGKVLVAGMDSSDEKNRLNIRQKVGMVFQNPDNQLIATRVEDDVAFGPENLGVPSIELKTRVAQSLNLVGMNGYEDHPPHKLSGGQKQRVAIAGIIAMEPDCLVLDEPTAMLDPQGRKEVMDTIEFLNKEKGITVVHITHFMEETINSDRIFVMNNGSIIKEGKPREIFKTIDDLKKIDLDVPVVVEMRNELNKLGFNLPDILSINELVNYIC
ncbi:energy-coupling factor transporter ATPase [Natronospora cellulosivora (SeqCode)]